VLSIVSSRKAKGGQTEYLVRWRGYEAEEDNTWEPAGHLHKDLIRDFEAETVEVAHTSGGAQLVD